MVNKLIINTIKSILIRKLILLIPAEAVPVGVVTGADTPVAEKKQLIHGDNMTIYDYGVDINSDLNFTNGDIALCEYEDNICQAVANRLRTIQDSLDLFYVDYGSFLTYFFGWRKTNETLNFIKLEIENVLRKDPRINNFTIDLEYIKEGVLINIVLTDFGEVNLNLVLNNEGVEVIE